MGRRYRWSTGWPGTARHDVEPARSGGGRAVTGCRASRAVPLRASCLAFVPGMARRAVFRTVPARAARQISRGGPAHSLSQFTTSRSDTCPPPIYSKPQQDLASRHRGRSTSTRAHPDTGLKLPSTQQRQHRGGCRCVGASTARDGTARRAAGGGPSSRSCRSVVADWGFEYEVRAESEKNEMREGERASS